MVERPASLALPKPVIQARRISRGAMVARRSSTASEGVSSKRWPQSCSPRRLRYRRSAIVRAASASGACTSNTFMRLRMGSGIARSSLAVATQMSWLASIATSANSSVKAPAVSCSSRLYNAPSGS